MRFLTFTLCFVLAIPASARQPVRSKHGMVVAMEGMAADAGISVLKSGGNAGSRFAWPKSAGPPGFFGKRIVNADDIAPAFQADQQIRPVQATGPRVKNPRHGVLRDEPASDAAGASQPSRIKCGAGRADVEFAQLSASQAGAEATWSTGSRGSDAALIIVSSQRLRGAFSRADGTRENKKRVSRLSESMQSRYGLIPWRG